MTAHSRLRPHCHFRGARPAPLAPVRRAVASAAAWLVTFAAGGALAAPGRIHAVFWPDDTSTRAQVDAFFECLTASSTYGSTWAAQYGLGPVTYAGSYVLPTDAPSSVTLGGNLDSIIETAFEQGTLPAPETGTDEEYLFYFPSSSTGGDSSGGRLCTQGGMCAEHGSRQLAGYTFDYALVPISCNMCAPGLEVDTIGGEHEAAEGLADLAGASYEVGDGCENPGERTTIACCGTTYTIQPLAGSGGEYDCQTIASSGSPVCGLPEAGSGGSSPGGDDAAEPPPSEDGGGGRGVDGGGTDGDAGARAGSDGGGADGGSGGTSTEGGGPSGADASDAPSGGSDASTGDGSGSVPSSPGCSCNAAGGDTAPGPIAAFAGLTSLIALGARRRRRAACQPPAAPHASESDSVRTCSGTFFKKLRRSAGSPMRRPLA